MISEKRKQTGKKRKYFPDKERNLSHFPSLGSDAPPPLLGVENVKIRENSEKIREPRGSLRDPLQPFLGP